MSEQSQNDVQAGAPSGVAAGNKRWYVVHAYSGMEKSVQRALKEEGLA